VYIVWWIGFEGKFYSVIQYLKDSACEYVENYLVNHFLDVMKASRKVILAVNTLMSLDALYLVRLFLTHYGLAKFVNYVFWIGIFI
jgi:hypothetical protein